MYKLAALAGLGPKTNTPKKLQERLPQTVYGLTTNLLPNMNKWHYPQDCLACYPGPSSNFTTNTSPPTTKPQQLHIYSDVPSLLLPWNLSRSSRAFQETVWKSAYNEYLTQLAPICFAAPQRNYLSGRRLNFFPHQALNSSGTQISCSLCQLWSQYPLCKSFPPFFFLDSNVARHKN